MGGIIINKIADNIISPLGLSSQENFDAVMRGDTRLKLHSGMFGLPEDFVGSILDRNIISQEAEKCNISSEKYTFFETIAIMSIIKAAENIEIDLGADDVVFVLSSTKGNVEVLESNPYDERYYLSQSADKITRFFKNSNRPIVASNACISGVCAQIAALRFLKAGLYRTAVVVGCDTLSKFIVSGFQSFKALSPEQCKPFDKNRQGLNLGEAVGTLILQTSDAGDWEYITSSIHNDANHISGPSRTGEGTYRVLNDMLSRVNEEDLSFVNLHGTATNYNDEMESIAIERAGLSGTPCNGLKGYFGHTLGAAGIIETILSMFAVDNSVILPTKGFSEQGTSQSLNVVPYSRSSEKRAFFKVLSGFGGSNAGIAYRKKGTQL